MSISRVRWVQNGAVEHESIQPGVEAITDTHEYDAVLFVEVTRVDGSVEEWSSDNGEDTPDWARGALAWARGEES